MYCVGTLECGLAWVGSRQHLEIRRALGLLRPERLGFANGRRGKCITTPLHNIVIKLLAIILKR